MAVATSMLYAMSFPSITEFLTDRSVRVINGVAKIRAAVATLK